MCLYIERQLTESWLASEEAFIQYWHCDNFVLFPVRKVHGKHGQQTCCSEPVISALIHMSAKHNIHSTCDDNAASTNFLPVPTYIHTYSHCSPPTAPPPFNSPDQSGIAVGYSVFTRDDDNLSRTIVSDNSNCLLRFIEVTSRRSTRKCDFQPLLLLTLRRVVVPRLPRLTLSNRWKYCRRNEMGLSGWRTHSCTMQSFRICWMLCDEM